jgi:hypothetical protein
VKEEPRDDEEDKASASTGGGAGKGKKRKGHEDDDKKGGSSKRKHASIASASSVDNDESHLLLLPHWADASAPAALLATQAGNLKVVRLLLATLLLEHAHVAFEPYKKEVIKFAWGCLKHPDVLTKSWAYLCTSRFIAVIDPTAKVTMQIYIQLLKSHQLECRDLTRRAIDALVPSLSVRLEGPGDLLKAMRWTKRILNEEGNSTGGTYYVLPSFSCLWSLSLSLSRSVSACMPACLHFLTLHDTSLTIIPHSLNQSSINTILTSLITLQVLSSWRTPGSLSLLTPCSSTRTVPTLSTSCSPPSANLGWLRTRAAALISIGGQPWGVWMCC